MHLIGERLLVAVGLGTPLHRLLQRIECAGQAQRRNRDGIGITHLAIRRGHQPGTRNAKIVHQQLFTKRTLRRVEREGQRLTATAATCLCMTQNGPRSGID